MTLLALDLATRTGWAVAVPPYRPSTIALQDAAGVGKTRQNLSGVRRFTDLAYDHGRLFYNFEEWLNEKMNTHQPDKLVYEAALPRHSGSSAAQIALGLVGILLKEAVRTNTPIWHISGSKLKKFATGKGAWPKGQAKAKMKQAGWNRGWVFADDNECDALWLAEYACEVFARVTPEKVLAAI